MCAFDQANYACNAFAFDNATEQQHIDVFVAARFTVIPEPFSALFSDWPELGFCDVVDKGLVFKCFEEYFD